MEDIPQPTVCFQMAIRSTLSPTRNFFQSLVGTDNLPSWRESSIDGLVTASIKELQLLFEMKHDIIIFIDTWCREIEWKGLLLQLFTVMVSSSRTSRSTSKLVLETEWTKTLRTQIATLRFNPWSTGSVDGNQVRFGCLCKEVPGYSATCYW